MSAWKAGPPRLTGPLDGDVAVGTLLRVALTTGEDVTGLVCALAVWCSLLGPLVARPQKKTYLS